MTGLDLSLRTAFSLSSSSAPSPSEPDFKSRMLQNGWCPHQINQILRTYKEKDNNAISSLSTISRSGFRNSEHSHCAMAPRCVANNVDLSNYVTRHVEPTCVCGMVAVAYDQIVDIISKKGVPLVFLQESKNGTIQLHVESRTTHSRYIAISHVWADGLGNPSDNALPYCQLYNLWTWLKNLPRYLERESFSFLFGRLVLDYKRLNLSISKSNRSPLFWIDTLCIPVKEQHIHLRTQAISDMASIYAAAVQVLVLDSELCKTSTSSVPAWEILARINHCVWNSRSWTLQEGVMGRQCIYQFADAAIDPIQSWCLSGRREGEINQAKVWFPSMQNSNQAKLFRALYFFHWNILQQGGKGHLKQDQSKLMRSSFAKAPIIKQIFHFLWRIVDWFRQSHLLDYLSKVTQDIYRTEQFVRTWNELANRSTTMTEDIHTIVANLLDFNVAAVKKLGSEEDRMRGILFSHKVLPFSLFYNTGPRYRSGHHHQNRWVPVELSQTTLHCNPTMSFFHSGLLLDRGLGPSNPFILQIHSELLEADRFLLQISGVDNIYIVDLCRSPEDEFDVTRYASTYLILPNSPDATNGELGPGACFHMPSVPEISAQNTLSLVFDCPLRIHQQGLDESENIHGDGVLPSYTATAVSEYLQVLILCDTIPNFTPLTRRFIYPKSKRFFNILWIVCFILIIGIIVIDNMKTPSIDKRVPGYLLAGTGSLLSFIWVLPVASPLSYRLWLRSFEEDAAEKPLPWWAFLITSQKRVRFNP